ncbi:carbonic anhydrase [Halomonas koreensis]|uniref:carbonic anhydrase n=1 Tax=Halomonas koreensis TaxID=245385 RepID=A0ABU1G6I7_9GAMM|nr:carbonic anhydrase family protein [Halomonas koreensis]MDR5868520.1 carbonic anhydrase family protein [Halomonas koreensis]
MSHCRAMLVALSALVWCLPAGAGDASWSYDGERGPEHWARLAEAYAMCGQGRNQSPVDIDEALPADLPPLSIDYAVHGERVVHDGHTLEVAFPRGNVLGVDGRRYRLRQLHFHVPGEHRRAGAGFAMELHLVHATDGGRLAVLALPYVIGAPEPALESLLEHAPGEPGQEATLSPALDAGALVGEPLDYYRYSGSLTTPPCSEGVLWLVASTPGQLGASQLARLADRLGEANHRPVQPLNARRVLE